MQAAVAESPQPHAIEEKAPALAKSSAPLTRPKAKNRREWPRYTAERNFALAVNVEGKVLPCTVADVSLGGAKLIFDSELPAPALSNGATVELSHPEAEPVHCATVWRGGKEIGIEFDFSEDSLGLISVCIRNMIDLERHPEALAG